MRPPEHPVALALLSLPALLYEGAVRLRNRYYDRGGTSRQAGVPVVSVGNLTVGGTGKTPVVAWLAKRLRERGIRPAVVSRGYGGRAGKGPTLVSDGSTVLCAASECGDEPYLLALNLPGALVVVGSDRFAVAEEARCRGADLVILDDGFQHRRLARDLDIVLLDASNPFGNHRLLPAGMLREPVAGLRRADLIVITRSRRDESFPVIERVVRHHNRSAPILRAGHRAIGFVDRDGSAVERPRRAVAFCGIGNPTRFRTDLHAEGVELVDFLVHRDHHPYTADEIHRMRDRAGRDAAALVTTEKDLARLGPDIGFDGPPVPCALRIEAEPFEPDLLIGAALEAAERPRR